MRTTLTLDDGLLDAAKRVAHETQRSLSQVVEDAVRESLARRRQAPARPVKLPVFRGNGLRPGVDLDDSAALLEVMEGPDEAP